MKLEDLKEVTELRDKRQEAMGLRAAAVDGTAASDLYLWRNGERFDALSIISKEYVMQSVICACDDLIERIDERLTALGVQAPRHNPHKRDADDWRQTAEMYVRAWMRELGGPDKMAPKRHLIDALVLTTQWLREKAERRPA